MGEIKAAKSKLNDSVVTINGPSDTSSIMEMDTD